MQSDIYLKGIDNSFLKITKMHGFNGLFFNPGFYFQMYDKVSEIEKEMFEQQKTHRQKLQEVAQEAKNEIETIKLKNDKEKEELVGIAKICIHLWSYS